MAASTPNPAKMDRTHFLVATPGKFSTRNHNCEASEWRHSVGRKSRETIRVMRGQTLRHVAVGAGEDSDSPRRARTALWASPCATSSQTTVLSPSTPVFRTSAATFSREWLPQAHQTPSSTGHGPGKVTPVLRGGDFSSASLNQSSSLSPLVTRLGAPNQLSLLLSLHWWKESRKSKNSPGCVRGIPVLGRPRSREPADYPQFMNWLFSRRKTGPR